MKLRDVIERTEAHFKKLGFDRPRFEAEMALSAALKWKRMDLFLKLEIPLSEEEVQVCREFVSRRSKGEPLAYIEKQKEFYGLPFYVDQNVLIPRPDTEHLVDKAITVIKKYNLKQILDIGSGSGAIAISILKNTEGTQSTCVDISQKAVDISIKNAEINEVLDRMQIQVLDFFDSKQVDTLDFSSIDVVVSNPPYIAEEDLDIQKEVKAFEPHLALFAKNNGLACYQAWFQTLSTKTKTGCHFIFEIGHKQKADVTKILLDLQVFKDIECIRDYSGKDRIIYCIKK